MKPIPKVLDMKLVEKTFFEINVKKKFSFSELNRLIPLVLKLTDAAQLEVNHLLSRIDSKSKLRNSLEKNQELEYQINGIIDRWESKIEKLGGYPKGLWLADFDSGEGFYCWKFPEPEIQFYHGYQDGFSGRKPINHHSLPIIGLS